jgi:co-chaperonin GroES (HSP10)
VKVEGDVIDQPHDTHTLPFRPLGARVVIQADVEDRAPEATASGLIVAKTLAAAVEGSDAEDSWFVGTVVALGPLVNHFDIRPYVLRRLRNVAEQTLWWEYKDKEQDLIHGLAAEVEALPPHAPDPIHLGDRVVFSWAAGQQLTIDGVKYLILHHSEVLAVLE